MSQDPMPRAVLWDMDGTLIDSEPYWIKAEYELVEEHGGTWSEEKAHLLVGNALEVSAQLIIDHTGIPLSTREIVDRLLARVIEQVRAHVPWRPGARELLGQLRDAGVPCALVTMSWRSFADEVIAALPPGSFAVSVTGDEVTRGKPDPEPYLRAAELIGVPAPECIALEDSGTGTRSAVQARVPTVTIPHIVEVPAIAGAIQVETLEGITPAELVRLASRA